jgi:hypothetical protein
MQCVIISAEQRGDRHERQIDTEQTVMQSDYRNDGNFTREGSFL